MFDADRPIQKSEQDRLGRTVFAKSLARCILDHKNTERHDPRPYIFQTVQMP